MHEDDGRSIGSTVTLREIDHINKLAGIMGTGLLTIRKENYKYRKGRN